MKRWIWMLAVTWTLAAVPVWAQAPAAKPAAKAAGKSTADHAKAEHAKDEHGKDDHAKDEHGKDGHGKEEEEPEFTVTGGGVIPSGWAVRLDGKDAKIQQLKIDAAEGSVHTRTAVSVALYRDSDRMKGTYHVGATFAQNEGSPGHAEPYGLFIGGADLQTDSVRYTSFVVRSDGKFQIRRRVGRKNTDVVEGWVDAGAIHQAGEDGKCSNQLLIETSPQAVRFLINGTEVHKAKPDEVDTDGIAGWRMSHNTDLTISNAMRMQM